MLTDKEKKILEKKSNQWWYTFLITAVLTVFFVWLELWILLAFDVIVLIIAIVMNYKISSKLDEFEKEDEDE